MAHSERVGNIIRAAPTGNALATREHSEDVQERLAAAPLSGRQRSESSGRLTERVLPVDPGFAVHEDVEKRVLKGEDMAFRFRADERLLGRTMPTPRLSSSADFKLNYDVFVLMDGHGGVTANKYVAEHFISTLQPQMPRTIPTSFFNARGNAYAAQVRSAITRTLVKLNEDFSKQRVRGGCTITVALVSGNLLTVANLGDSDAVLDTFYEVIPMTIPHRINDNVDEQARLGAMNTEIAPLNMNMSGPARGNAPGLGPLRAWPGGLCVSRSIGDSDVGTCIIAQPHIRQVIVPEQGCRLIVCSDGVWDVLSARIVVQTTRNKSISSATSAVVTKCLRAKQGALIDDTTCQIIDFIPHHVSSFKGYNPERSVHSDRSQSRRRTDRSLHSQHSVTANQSPILFPDGSVKAAVDPAALSSVQEHAASSSGRRAPGNGAPDRPRSRESTVCGCCFVSTNATDSDPEDAGEPRTPLRRDSERRSIQRDDASAASTAGGSLSRPSARSGGGGGSPVRSAWLTEAEVQEQASRVQKRASPRDRAKAERADRDASSRRSESVHGNSREPSVSRHGSGSASKTGRSLGGRLKRRAYPPLVLYHDVDMHFEPLPAVNYVEATSDYDSLCAESMPTGSSAYTHATLPAASAPVLPHAHAPPPGMPLMPQSDPGSLARGMPQRNSSGGRSSRSPTPTRTHSQGMLEEAARGSRRSRGSASRHGSHHGPQPAPLMAPHSAPEVAPADAAAGHGPPPQPAEPGMRMTVGPHGHDVDPHAGLDMDFMPGPDHSAPQSGNPPNWHTTPFTSEDLTTRPHLRH